MSGIYGSDGVYYNIQNEFYNKFEIDEKLSQLENKLKYEDTQSRCIVMDDIERILHGFTDRLRELILERTSIEIPMEDFTDIITWSMEDAFR